ncbi:MAG: hypothetical protein NVSMB25_17090 [Thermoleophilaceae bacterium]
MDSWDIRTLDVQPHQPRILSSDEEARVIALNLPAGESMQEHQTYERAYLMVADGRVSVSSGRHTISGGTGFVAHFEPNERREVRAEENSRLVLVLGPWPGVGHGTAGSQAGAVI